MNKLAPSIPNKIKQPAQCCVYCGKSYKKITNLNKHVVVCDLIQKSKRRALTGSGLRIEEDEEEPLPSQRKMFEMLMELGQKYSRLEEKVDDYVNYVVEQWLEENAIAIESGLRAELAEDFISGLHKLFAENYINVPEDKVELVDELATKVEQLESKLNEEIEKSIGYKKSLIEATKQEVTRSVCEGLTETQVEKIKSLAESVEFSTEDEYQNKLETIRENYFPSGLKKAAEEQLHEQVSAEDAGETKKQVSADPYVSSVANAISKTKL